MPPSPTRSFTERDFYLGEFRRRSLAIKLPDLSAAEADRVRAVVRDLIENDTRVILLATDPSRLEPFVSDDLVAVSGPDLAGAGMPDWVASLWRRLRSRGVVGVCLPESGFEDACASLTLRLRLAKLVWLTPSPIARRTDGHRASSVNLQAISALIESERAGPLRVDGSAVPLLCAIREMLSGGLPSVNVCAPGALDEELFTYAGSGTFFTREHYTDVRRLALDDFETASDLIERGVEEGYLLPRSEVEVERILASGFAVFVEGRFVAGIGALLPHPGVNTAEIAALYTLTRFLGEGVGGQLVRFALEWARSDGLDAVFSCTTSERVERFFERNGFVPAAPEELPAEKWKGYDTARLSRVRCLKHDLGR